VFLGGSRLKKFMESVEAVTAASPRTASETVSPTAVTQVAATADQDSEQTAATVWAPLLSAGLKLVQALTAAPGGNGNGSGGAQSAASSLIETDNRTGHTYLKLPMPEPRIVRELGEALSRLVSSLAKRSE
jgi:hypothetical protein